MEETHQANKAQNEIDSRIVKNEVGLFEATKRSQKVCQNCSMSNKVNVCSSTMGISATILRNHLGDETLDALIVMCQKFNKNN